MPLAYSKEMRRDVLTMDAEGVPTQEIAIELNASKSWVRRVKQEFRPIKHEPIGQDRSKDDPRSESLLGRTRRLAA